MYVDSAPLVGAVFGSQAGVFVSIFPHLLPLGPWFKSCWNHFVDWFSLPTWALFQRAAYSRKFWQTTKFWILIFGFLPQKILLIKQITSHRCYMWDVFFQLVTFFWKTFCAVKSSCKRLGPDCVGFSPWIILWCFPPTSKTETYFLVFSPFGFFANL